MKHLLLLASLLLSTIIYAQCPTGSFADLRTQADVDAFGANFPDCTNLQFLAIGTEAATADHITDLTPLSSLSTIATLEVKGNDDLLNLNGFGNLLVENLTIQNNESFLQPSTTGQIQVTLNLRVIENPALINLQGLESTTTLEVLEIRDNDITSLTGLDNLTQVSFLAQIDNNTTLTNLTGLGSLTSTRALNVKENENLLNLNGLGAMVTENLTVRFNPVMSEISTTSTVQATVSLGIFYNASLNNLIGLETTTSLADLDIVGNDIQQLTGLDNLTEVTDIARITLNTSLTNLTGLGNLVSTSNFTVLSNEDLINLNGIGQLTTNLLELSNNSALAQVSTTSQITVNSILRLIGHPQVLNLEGLESTTSLDEFSLSNNDIQSLSGLDNVTAINFFASTCDTPQYFSILF